MGGGNGAGRGRPRGSAPPHAGRRRLGRNNSHFGTPNGWMDKGNTYYTARDLVRLADALLTRYPA